jgi:CRAL/TRIO domain
VPAKFITQEDWKVCYAAFYYLFDAMHPDIVAVRAGIVALFECENAGWKNFSYHLEKHAAHLTQDAYPMRMRSLVVLHAPTIFTVMYALIKPFLSVKVRNAVRLNGTKDQVLQDFPKMLIPASWGGVHTKMDKDRAMFDGLKIRYANMATFNL